MGALRIAKFEGQIYGQRSERSAQLIDQLALEFEELSAGVTEDELAAQQAAAKTTTVARLHSRDRRGEHPQAHLEGYAGILQADAATIRS